MKREILVAFAILSLSVGMFAGSPRADEWSKSYAINGRADLHVSTDDGNVSITSADQKQIDARVITDGYKIGPHDVRIEESQNGNQVTVNVRISHGGWPMIQFGGHKSLRVELRVPRDLDIDAHTGDGNVSTQGASGRIHIDSGDGNVTADGLKGDISFRTGDGNIQATNLDGAVRADTGDGRVVVKGRFDSLNLKSGDGNIDAEASSGSTTTSGWTLQSGDGQVFLRVPGDFHADLEAHTGDGSITLDMPISVEGSLSRSSIRGKMNGGGGFVKITTGDGSIHIAKL
jgi:hypothetical protein